MSFGLLLRCCLLSFGFHDCVYGFPQFNLRGVCYLGYGYLGFTCGICVCGVLNDLMEC